MYVVKRELIEGLREADRTTGHNLLVQGPGPVFHTGFTQLKEVNDYRDTLPYDKDKLKKFVGELHDNGIRIIGRGLWYISAAHTSEDIRYAIKAATRVLKGLSGYHENSKAATNRSKSG